MRPDGVDSIIAFMPQNSLLVSGDPAGIDQLREILTVLDQPTKQVEIATKFIEVDVTDQNSFGIDWYVSNGSLEFFQLGFAPGNAVNNVLRWAKGKFEATLGVSLSRNRGEVVNEPHITTQNNVSAYISFSTEIPYFSSTISYNSFGQREVTITDDTVEVEQTLEVTPRINADDTISMYLTPIMQDQTGTVVGPDGTSLPIVASQELETQVTVADGETVVLGGMIRKQKSTNTRSTPLLSEIPIIGKLFQSKQVNNVNSELLVFVTPRIVRDVPAP
jgi:type II secretory pathway component GspD/PulD (secretin)